MVFLRLSFLALILVSNSVLSQSFEWATQFKGPGFVSGNSIAVDDSGYIYSTGWYYGTIDFDPGLDTLNMTTASEDIYITKMNSYGELIWAKGIGGSLNDRSAEVIVDSQGSVFVTGYFRGTADFNPSTSVFNLTSVGNEDAFVLKLNYSGDFLWAKKIGGAGSDKGNEIKLSNANEIYVIGDFFNTVDFDPGAGTSNLTSAGSADSFILKLDSLGNFIWVNQIAGPIGSVGRSIYIDSIGNVFSCFGFTGTIDADPGLATYNLTSVGDMDFCVIKLNSSGDFLWAIRIGGAGSDSPNEIELDSNGDIIISGAFQNAVDFDPGAPTYYLVSSFASGDIFVLALTNNGEFKWARKAGGNGADSGISISIDYFDNVYVCGVFENSVDFDPGTNMYNLTSNGGRDIFIWKIDSLGNFAWARQFGATAWDESYSIVVDKYLSVYNTGYFQQTVDFNPGTDTFLLASLVSNNAYILKLNKCNAIGSALSDFACNSYTINGQTYTNSGTFNQYFLMPDGCDSILTLNLTIDYVDSTVTQSGLTLTSNSDSAIYQWVDCNNSFLALSGETNQSFTATANGSYAVVVLQGPCRDTSACFDITTVSTNEIETDAKIDIYPNPTHDKVYVISTGTTIKSVTIFDNSGRNVCKKDYYSKQTIEIDLRNFESGNYMLITEDVNLMKVSKSLIIK